MFYDFLPKNQLLPIIFYTQNGHFSIFEGVLLLWRHNDVIHKWLVLILVSMERGCLYLYTGSKFRVIWPSVLIIQRGVATTLPPLWKICWGKHPRRRRISLTLVLLLRNWQPVSEVTYLSDKWLKNRVKHSWKFVLNPWSGDCQSPVESGRIDRKFEMCQKSYVEIISLLTFNTLTINKSVCVCFLFSPFWWLICWDIVFHFWLA